VCVEGKRGYEASKPFWEIQFKLVNVFLISKFLVSNGSTLGNCLRTATNQVLSLVLVNQLENHVQQFSKRENKNRSLLIIKRSFFL